MRPVGRGSYGPDLELIIFKSPPQIQHFQGLLLRSFRR